MRDHRRSRAPAGRARLWRQLITVLENMGGAAKRSTSFLADDLADNRVLRSSTRSPSSASPAPGAHLPRIPGLPDDAFVHDGQLTKREVRAATLAELAPYPGRAALGRRRRLRLGRHRMDARGPRLPGHRLRAEAERLQMIARQRRSSSDVRASKIVAGEAPDTLAGQAAARCRLPRRRRRRCRAFSTAWARSETRRPPRRQRRDARGRSCSLSPFRQHGGELVRIDVSYLDAIGRYRALTPAHAGHAMAGTQAMTRHALWRRRRPGDPELDDAQGRRLSRRSRSSPIRRQWRATAWRATSPARSSPRT